ncbi:uncharacterized protein ATC70_003339 [Mucor velutinosus]|uniref:Protein Zds1 C-terminal domain-containing protein n=1 Tax=Mucor velutinosus TaxID=708070 RepID=A0AAN7DBG9_9FUNG|nr:hypothetical protein ATC70_003339 [Mucor velutinosus]
MSTFYIYPLDQKDHQFQHHHHHHNQPPNGEPGLSQLKSLSATGLSRILEIPLCLLENTNSKDQQQQQQIYCTSNSSIAPSHVASKEETSIITATDELVTHSFANRKRSIVKRRKSVLSASFTAEDEAEAIRIDREQTLAALERGHRSEGERKEETETQEIAEQEEGILEHDPLSNRESIFDAPKNIYSQENLIFDVHDGDVHDFELLGKPQEMNRGSMRKEEKEEEEENGIPSKQATIQQQQQTEGANVVNPKDSAIDLRITALEQEKDGIEQARVDVADNDSCTKVIDLSVASSLFSSSAIASSDPPFSSSSSSVSSCSPAPTRTTALKKKSSWSPRRMFSASSKKSTIDEKQEKFNISSLFSRKSSSSSSKKSNQSTTNNSSKSLECTSKAKNDSCTLSKNTVPFNYTRLPIHTERAIYRLSHLKLTTPRRPLRDQVIISNLMFWYFSIVSTNSTTTENEPAPMEHLVMTKKACRMQQQQIQHKKRRMRNQVRPENSNAMDIITKQQKKPRQHRPHVNKKTAIRPYSNNSSSEEDDDDEDGDDTDTDSDDNSDSFSFTSSNSSLSMSEDVEYLDQKKKAKKTSKYSIFSSKKKDKKWLPSFSKGNNRLQQQQLQSDDDDDIPLAMYQTK